MLLARERGLSFLPAFPVFLWQWHVLLEEPLLLVVLLVLLVLLLLMCRWWCLVVLLKVRLLRLLL